MGTTFSAVWRLTERTFVAYVPYSQWTESDPRITSVLQSSLTSYRHELLLNNLPDIPLLVQHGGADDNVPTLHSRRMKQLVAQSDFDSSLMKYVELDGKGHWFEGVMTTPPLLQFYQRLLAGRLNKTDVPSAFSVVIADPAAMGSKHGLRVDQKISPDQLGRMDVRVDKMGAIWRIQTSNVLRFHVQNRRPEDAALKTIVVDGYAIDLPPGNHENRYTFDLSDDGCWNVRLNAIGNARPSLINVCRFLMGVVGVILPNAMEISSVAWQPYYEVRIEFSYLRLSQDCSIQLYKSHAIYTNTSERTPRL